jgi:Fic family protein
MDPLRFEQSTAGRTIKVPESDSAYWAFVPNPLPPSVSMDSELVAGISSADRALGRLGGVGEMFANPRLLVKPFVHREAVSSSRIEGTLTGLSELYAFEASGITGPDAAGDEPDAREVLNYVLATEYGIQQVKRGPPGIELICELHKRLLRGVSDLRMKPGELRDCQNWIGPPGSTKYDASYVPPPVGEMQECLARFENYVRGGNTLPPLIRLGLVHYQFEAIHPFTDGNGRIGRLLISLLAVNWGLLTAPLLYLSPYFELNRDEYYQRLRAVSERGQWREWLLYFLRGVTLQSQDTALRARKLLDLQARWRDQLMATRAPARLLKLIDRLFDTPYITIPRARKLLGVTHRAAANSVRKLVAGKILRRVETQGRLQMFVAQEILDTIGEPEPERVIDTHSA